MKPADGNYLNVHHETEQVIAEESDGEPQERKKRGRAFSTGRGGYGNMVEHDKPEESSENQEQVEKTEQPSQDASEPPQDASEPTQLEDDESEETNGRMRRIKNSLVGMFKR